MNPRAAATAITALVADVARQLAAVVPATWRGDRVFRWAVMTAGLSLCILLGHFTGLRVRPQPLPETIQAGPPSPALLAATASGPPQAVSSPPLASLPPPAGLPVPVIAPGQPLGTVAPATAGSMPDRFGMVTRPHPPASGPTP